ncbi:unnamed protein product [Moneuplotes crassus]|uniref:Kinesin motor domain-containing protein n=1 Tax=Euplotes crassus TaxID=5936 RepID=A0AAD1XKE7_EUPCR|nr:unnamed protein product [Moneuplotes crassus]
MKPGANRSRKDIQTTKKSEQIKVCIRMRPLLIPYEEESLWFINEKQKSIYSSNADSKYSEFESTPGMKIKDDLRALSIDPQLNHTFHFDHVFGDGTSTPEIYHVIARPITKAALVGYNGSIFMYGQTTSGKTYTMLGTPETPGILPCTVRDIFNFVTKNQSNEYKIWISYLEIYNEAINDLLNPGSTNMKLKEDPKYGTKVVGLKAQQVWTFDQAIILMNFGEEHRMYKETSVHEHSSRSHTIFRIYIESISKTEDTPKKCSVLNLVDLAGSERLTEYDGKRDTSGETGHINKSLFILANVINKLAEDKHSHIPYRDSKLTRILSNALGGNSLTAIICNVSPAAINHYQTLSTLRFATRAKIVKNKPIVNELGEVTEEAKIYKKQIQNLREQLSSKEDDIKLYAKKQLEMQRHLNSSNNMNAKLMNELQFMKKMNSKNEAEKKLDISSSSISQSKEYQNLYQEFKQEREKSLELFKELEETKKKLNDLQEIQIERQKQDAFETMIVFTEQVLGQNNISIHLNPQQRSEWVDKVGTLLNDYQDDCGLLQDKYLQQLCVQYSKSLPKIAPIDQEFLKMNPNLDCYLNIVPDDKITEYDEEENSDDISYEVKSSATRVIEDIEKRKIFDDIRIDFESIVDSIAPEDNPSRLNQMLVSYYEEIHEVLQKRLDECQDIIERYMKELIESKKRNIQKQMENLAFGRRNSSRDPTIMNQDNQMDIGSITSEHNKRLNQLREQYESFLKNAENEFFNVLKSVKGDSDMNSNSNDNSPKEKNFQEEYNKFNKKQTANLNREGERSRSNLSSHVSISSLNENSSQKPSIKKPISKDSGSKSGYIDDLHEKRSTAENYEEEKAYPPLKLSASKRMKKKREEKMTKSKAKSSGQKSQETDSVGSAKKKEHVSKPINKVQLNLVSCGWQHIMALSSQGQVYSWGNGNQGQLGHGTTHDIKSPLIIKDLIQMSINQIACGYFHSAAVAQGELFMWGNNSDARLILEKSTNVLTPSLTLISQLRKEDPDMFSVAELSLGYNHSSVITISGECFTAGSKLEGQLGGDPSDDTIEGDEGLPENCSPLTQVLPFGDDNSPKAISVTCGDRFTIVLDSNQDVSAFGIGVVNQIFEDNLPELSNNYQRQSLKAVPRTQDDLFRWTFNSYSE